MASLRAFRHFPLFNNQVDLKILYSTQLIRCYSQFPWTYKKPIYKKSNLKALEESGELEKLAHVPILPAFTNESCSDFSDPLSSKFINYIMREGKKEVARLMLRRTFENIKRIQVEKYNRAPPDEKDNIELDPKTILHKAIENSCPAIELKKLKKGGIYYQVPVPLVPNRRTFLGMNWLIEAGKEKERNVNLPEKLATELIDASLNQGRVINKKKELYKKCEANRAYAHFRWS